ncbi:MAG: HlyD family type I secretion periplasmic adaptor subunit, partial [Burkholderiales bacterium]
MRSPPRLQALRVVANDVVARARSWLEPRARSMLEPDASEFAPAAVEIQSRPPAPLGRAIAVAIMAFMVAFVLWAVWAQFDVVASAAGKVVPSARVKVLQPLEPGIVKAIHVRDGQTVKQGEILIELDPTTTQADKTRLVRDVMETKIDLQRLIALSAGKPDLEGLPPDADPRIVATQQQLLLARLAEHQQRMASLSADVVRRRAEAAAIGATAQKLRSTLPLIQRRLAMKESLAKQKYLSELSLIESRLEVVNHHKDIEAQTHRLREAQAGLAVAEQQRVQAEAEFRAKVFGDLAEAAKRLETATQDLVKAEQRTQQQTLVAPVAGIVHQLAVHTVGGVVTSAQPLLTIVPEGSSFEVEAQVLNRDIGFLRAGQPAAVKLDAFEYTKYGHIDGTIQWVGTDAVADQKMGLVYPVRITLASNELPNAVGG